MPRYEAFDAFLIFAKSRFTDKEEEIAENISKNLGKPFIFVCTITDNETTAETVEGREIVEGLVEDKTDIYVIHNNGGGNDDFERLDEDISLKLVKRRRDLFLHSLNKTIFVNTKDAKEIFQEAKKYRKDEKRKDAVACIEDFYSWHLIPSLKNSKIDFAITGDSGTGKSSFINAVRGIKGKGKRAAPVGVTETTRKATKYSHPNNENIVFWDLPGIGTDTHPNLKKYLKNIGDLEKYDAFLIFCKDRFTNFDKELAEKVMNDLKKPFFFIRTNVDYDLKNAKKKKKTFDEATVLTTMRNNCFENLKDLIHDEKDIHMIDNKATDKYDFQRLKESIVEALPVDKKESFVDSDRKLTYATARMKANILKAQLSKVIVLLMIVESEPEVFKNLILQEVIRYHGVFVQPGKKEKDLLKSKHLKEIEQKLKKERSFGNSIESIGDSPAKVQWAYNYLIDCINNLKNRYA
ncbi:T-cell-specific guanine nucleotide triphosphate-binding protein 2-like [Xenia sp. Carnegie-2017]|uniref:T-cell-specific guanine nucleotide triphosphate-binding protein 2-like n=1 Tax=Xenia sp. Carnegie-2017 TaxID=2897299 RepID=UPI001F03675B|nr:T-cell-specific guanine nucleotide triphosphate-binding protein 2-like [Xenia sp. Carnegie-2017]XP_046843717.1 T-cell-specific guanine nucleotide triphosphate-binding protein 2-like [Xenia sp. Carnegie-2017]